MKSSDLHRNRIALMEDLASLGVGEICSSEPSVPKKVRFGGVTIVEATVPWNINQNEDPLEKMEKLSDTDNLLPIQNCMKYPTYNLRPQMEDDAQTNCVGYIVLIIFLLLIFYLLWSVASKILLLEVESQMSDQTSNQNSGLFKPQNAIYNFLQMSR